MAHFAVGVLHGGLHLDGEKAVCLSTVILLGLIRLEMQAWAVRSDFWLDFLGLRVGALLESRTLPGKGRPKCCGGFLVAAELRQSIDLLALLSPRAVLADGAAQRCRQRRPVLRLQGVRPCQSRGESGRSPHLSLLWRSELSSKASAVHQAYAKWRAILDAPDSSAGKELPALTTRTVGMLTPGAVNTS